MIHATAPKRQNVETTRPCRRLQSHIPSHPKNVSLNATLRYDFKARFAVDSSGWESLSINERAIAVGTLTTGKQR